VSGFFQDILAGIERGVSGLGVPAESRTHEKRLLAMKAFPMLLDSLFRKMEDLFRAKDGPFCTYDFVASDARGQVKPSELCGRYFELISQGKDDQPLERETGKLRGWMGVLYSDGCKYMNDGMPKANEPVVGKGAKPVFMVELWGRCLTCAEVSGWRKNSWGALCRTFEDIPTAVEIWDVFVGLLKP